MTISDDDLAKWDARSRSTYAGLRNSVPVAQIIGELRDARRKFAAVEAECQNIANGAHATSGRQYGQGMAYAGKLIAAALAAGEAPTELDKYPQWCIHGLDRPHAYAFVDCPGPVPQGGTQ